MPGVGNKAFLFLVVLHERLHRPLGNDGRHAYKEEQCHEKHGDGDMEQARTVGELRVNIHGGQAQPVRLAHHLVGEALIGNNHRSRCAQRIKQGLGSRGYLRVRHGIEVALGRYGNLPARRAVHAKVLIMLTFSVYAFRRQHALMEVNQPQQHARFTPALPVRDEVEHRNGRNRNNQHNQRGNKGKAQTKFFKHQLSPNRTGRRPRRLCAPARR